MTGFFDSRSHLFFAAAPSAYSGFVGFLTAVVTFNDASVGDAVLLSLSILFCTMSVPFTLVSPVLLPVSVTRDEAELPDVLVVEALVDILDGKAVVEFVVDGLAVVLVDVLESVVDSNAVVELAVDGLAVLADVLEGVVGGNSVVKWILLVLCSVALFPSDNPKDGVVWFTLRRGRSCWRNRGGSTDTSWCGSCRLITMPWWIPMDGTCPKLSTGRDELPGCVCCRGIVPASVFGDRNGSAMSGATSAPRAKQKCSPCMKGALWRPHKSRHHTLPPVSRKPMVMPVMAEQAIRVDS